jgi:hypothetical protein
VALIVRTVGGGEREREREGKKCEEDVKVGLYRGRAHSYQTL